MKVLLDTCVWKGTKDTLAAAGYDVIWTGDWNEDPGDNSILEYAHREGRILVTLDKDFGDIAVFQGISHSGIVRLVRIPSSQQALICLHVLDKYGTELIAGAIVTAESNRLRIRTPSN